MILSDFLDHSPASVINCRFTDFSMMAQDANHVNGFSTGSSQVPNFQDCQFHGGMLLSDVGVNLTNCLLERVNSTLVTGGSSGHLQNCLFWRGSLSFGRGSFNGTIQDNLFDLALITDHGGYTYGYNGFCTNSTNNLLSLTNTNDVFLTSVAYQTNWYGNYYQPTNDSLFHVGSTNASLLGLYHYTTQTSQTKEGTNLVTIGYHYIALNSSGNPLDLNSNGIPDYLENPDGPAPPNITTQPLSQTLPLGTNASFTVVAVGEGPLTYQWSLNGTNISGATATSFTTNNIVPGSAGNYAVTVSNSGGSTASSNATLTGPQSRDKWHGSVAEGRRWYHYEQLWCDHLGRPKWLRE